MDRSWIGQGLLAWVTLLSGGFVFAEPLPQTLDLSVGETHLLSADVQRVAVGNGKLLSVSSPERGQLLLLAEGPGTTTLQLWLRDGQRQRIRVAIGAMDLDWRLEQVRHLLEGTRNVTARIAGMHIVLEGEQVSDADLARAAAIADSQAGVVLNFVGKLTWAPMIQMDVRILEVRRDQLRDLGLRWDSAAAGPSVGAKLGRGASASFAMSSQLASRLELLQQRGLAETIARPTLSCRSGGSARFVSGGEVPIPVSDGLGTLNVQYKEYGVILEVRPQADASGAIHAEIDTELSQIDDSVRVQNFPGFVKRRSATAVNLRDGETLVIAGLLARERGRNKHAVPGLGDLPVAGALFSTTHRLERQTELLVIITPRITDATKQGVELARGAELESGDVWRRATPGQQP
ncbi:MAG: pilus assembly protein CpaC [Pseudomonadota bacterium]